MDSVIVWKTRDPFYGLGPDGLEAVLKARLKGRVRQAWLFGSHATRTVNPDSDLDLIIIIDTDVPFIRRPALFDDLYDLVPALDLLVYTPEEFGQLEAQAHPEGGSGFWSSIMATRRQLL